MNFVFISPQFPRTYFNFCDRLKQRGVNVLGIGDTPYDELDPHVKESLTEYYRVPNMEQYEDMFKAVAYYSFHYGKIDWIESNNEYWLAQDARLRTDFNVQSGYQLLDIQAIKYKSQMKQYYEQSQIPCARYHLVSSYEAGKAFVEEVGYPVVVKPDNGVGAYATYRINNEEDLKQFYEQELFTQYIMEEFVHGRIVSYDGIMDSNKNVIFDTSHYFPTPIMDIVNEQVDMVYYSAKEIDPCLKEMGQACVHTFPGKSRFFHLEFFELLEDKEGLGAAGDYVGLEVNMRPPGGYTTDMMNFANDVDVYSIWADMVMKDATSVRVEQQRPYVCVFVSRRDQHQYFYRHEEIIEQYAPHLKMVERMPDSIADAMGNQMYTANFKTEEEAFAFVDFVHKGVS